MRAQTLIGNIAILAILGAAIYHNLHLKRQIEELEKKQLKIAQDTRTKEDALSKLRNEISTLRNSMLSTPSPCASVQKALPESRARITPPADQQFDAWRSTQRMKELEKYVVLTESERTAVSAAVSALPDLSFDNPKSAELLAAALGPERARKFLDTRNEVQARKKSERIEAEVFKLSRKLALSPTQEEEVRRIVIEVNEQTQQISAQHGLSIERVTAQHTLNGGDREALRKSYDEMKIISEELERSKSDLLQAKLRPVLQDQQFNKFLELEGD